MNKKSQDFSMDDVKKMANSPTGQQIVQLLQNLDGGKVQAIADRAAAGDMKNAEIMLQQLLGQKDLEQLKKTLEG